ncbi:Tyrosine-protein phosphatase pmp1-like protein [Elsinoe fawcettii]|nr:Tyrosine-protein phosphatase pmp1-like protein [Elsinoe fawcettii]
MPEVVEEGSHPDGEPQGHDGLKPMLLSPPNLYSTYLPQSHHHNESTSTSASESAGSSPTTTLSLADDSSMTEMSPGSSPESPMAKPPSNMPGQIRPHTSDDISRTPPQPSAFFDLQRPLTPGKRPRNLKNLAVNTTGAASAGRGAATAALPTVPAPSNVDTVAPLKELSFRRPPSPPKRRPSNLSLTIVTSAESGASGASAAPLVPPTPSMLRPNTLRHFQSSPSLPLSSQLQSSTNALPLPSLSRPSLERAQSDLQSRVDDEDFNFELPQSREEKPEAYPDGPICVLDPYVDLYLEPTAEQANKYDVIFNVASEVRNPYLVYNTPDPTKEGVRMDGGGGLQYAPSRSRRSSSEASDATVLKNPAESSPPTTPKATPEKDTFSKDLTSGEKKPEYIHMLWEHNTDIVSDLLRLVEVIDDRVRQRKKVLIHCQCGVSRSATLVVAYCMYVNPGMSVQQAYDTIKRRSKWIGPNMNLIMQLQEFSSKLAVTQRRPGFAGLRSLTPLESSGAWGEWRGTGSGIGARLDPRAPKTAPLPPPASAHPDCAIDNASLAVTPGPSSAPSGLSWPMTESKTQTITPDRKDGRALSVPGVSSLLENATDNGLTDVNNSPGRRRSSEKKRPQSLRFDSTHVSTIPEAVGPLLSPRSEEFAMTALQPPAEIAAEDKFGIMSPTTSSFNHTPLDRDALLGSLGMGSALGQDTSRRRTQNFSFPFRKSILNASAAEVAIGFNGTRNGNTVKQTLVVPSPTVDSLLDPLLSPRASSFTLNPFSHSVPTGPSPLSARLNDEDPRSPAQQGSNPIVRNIADAL